MTEVLKIGGNQLDDPGFILGMANAIATLIHHRKAEPPIIVHGGGKLISTLQERLGIHAQTVGGLRVTTPDVLQIVMMVLIGQVNPMLVTALQNAGVEAEGFNGADRNLLRAKPLIHPDGDLGRVGTIVKVNTDAIRQAIARGVVPVIAPVSISLDSARDPGFFNVNADQAAGAIAAAIGADRVTFVTNVPGVLADGHAIDRLTQADARELIRLGVASGGMAVKVEAAFTALDAGVAGARITDLNGLLDATGTLIVR